ncbi:hypothetical protein [Rhizobium sp. BK176]|uniref:hypothetical protein n=1 Tax=Rhizobium sp. BK176 TaxID=2587071 RepID=UPI00216A54C3|nr:hypothetical protein [Rhizobium sp. BK176]MCS4090237.1 hypothetical protein [Rhizobium sp. BK176]
MKIMDIDEVVYGVCREWYDSETTPLMHAVAYRSTGDKSRDIAVPALRSEIGGCLKECVVPENGEALAKACEILDRRVERDDVLLKLVELVLRAKDAGVDKEEFCLTAVLSWEDA